VSEGAGYWEEVREERAAIMQYLGGMPRQDAERQAGIYVQLQSLEATCQRVQARQQARGDKTQEEVKEQPKQEQITLPGFEAAFGGG
jgi:hypothetical protein